MKAILAGLLTVSIVPMQEANEVSRLIQALGDESPEKRAMAAQELHAIIKIALPALRKAAAEASDPQVRAAARELVANWSAGAVLWKHECPHGGLLVQPLKVLGESREIVLVVCGCASGRLSGLDPRTGAARWQSNPGERFATHFSLFGEIVLAHLNTGPDQIVAVDTVTGKTRWAMDGVKGLHRPLRTGDRVLVGGGDGIRSLDVRTGEVIWKLPTSDWILTPAVGKELVVSSGFDGKVRGIERETGKLRWEIQLKGRPSPAAIEGNRALVGSEEGLVALDLETGQKAWEVPLEGWSHDAPRVESGIVYYSTDYLGPKDEGGGIPTLHRHRAVELATGRVLRDQAQSIAIPSTGHLWKEDGGQITALDGRGEPLQEGTRCGVSGCDGVHRLTVRTVRVGADDAKLYAASDGRLRREANSPGGERLVVITGGFPIYSGLRYDGPRRSAVVCIRGVDADR